MRVGGRWKQLNLFLHRCAPTIPFCPGWTFAPTVGHRRFTFASTMHCSVELLANHFPSLTFRFNVVDILGVGVEDASRLC